MSVRGAGEATLIKKYGVPLKKDNLELKIQKNPKKPSVRFAEVRSILTTLMVHQEMSSVLHETHISNSLKCGTPGGHMPFRPCPWLVWAPPTNLLLISLQNLLLFSLLLLFFFSFPASLPLPPPFLFFLLPQRLPGWSPLSP